jgi:hypothetical protein
MPSDYAGDDSNFPELIQRPSDGDAPDQTAWLPAVDGLADRTAYLFARMRLIGIYSWQQDSMVGASYQWTGTSLAELGSGEAIVSVANCVAGDPRAL